MRVRTGHRKQWTAVLAFAWITAGATTAFCQGTRASGERGFGPIAMQTVHGEFQVRLLRREKNTVWLLQETRSGDKIEAGVAAADIQAFTVALPSFIEHPEAAKTREQELKAIALIDRYVATLKPFRDLPGIPVDTALLAKGSLLERQARWQDALACYGDVLKQSADAATINKARLRAGLCRAHLGMKKQALEDLEEATVAEDDIELLSEVYFTRGRLLAGLGRHKDAVLAQLYLVVFHPFVADNEPRGLAAAVESYIALEDWESALKTVKALRAGYPGGEYTRTAEAALQPYEKKLQDEALFAEPDTTESNETESGVEE